MYVVIDIEFYHNKKKELLGSIKQLGAFKFNEDYEIIDIFEMTVTKYTTKQMLESLFNDFISNADTIYMWDKGNDIKVLNSELNFHKNDIKIIDVQEYFKTMHFPSLSTISGAMFDETEGRHNALVDAEYTYEIIKDFNLNDLNVRKTLSKYNNLHKIEKEKTNKIRSQK